MTEPTRQPIGLTILARRAELGKGKTRLAATVGATRALAIYRQLVARTAAAARASGLPTKVLFDPEPGDQDLWPPEAFTYGVQPAGTDLGARIAAALDGTDGDGALIIGTDCPELTGAVLAEAAAALADDDAVLGPSADGGFYLLGLRGPVGSLFDGIAWSTSEVADRLRANLRRAGLTWRELPTLRDVDTEADWDAYRASLPSATT